ncbi:leucine-rich_repeat domain-containing protein [Hexamita inflata]|uniref:Leucine-rich repeat domain-containing protein n=1 Tax=Hexamita inflata TaxID=28002 RepID=A0AA86Q2G5_9EUKA|nr:leucine-rich repeat domain-containing protein [Hexamita inflata]
MEQKDNTSKQQQRQKVKYISPDVLQTIKFIKQYSENTSRKLNEQIHQCKFGCIQQLCCGHKQLTYVEQVRSMVYLMHLSLIDNQISDVSPLINLTHLQYLDIRKNYIQSIESLKNMVNLTSLKARSNRIVNIFPLHKLTNLETLMLGKNNIYDINPLHALSKLKYLDLFNNKIVDISSLSHLQQLEYLDLFNNQVIDISPLYDLQNLNNVNLNTNFIASLDAYSHIYQMYKQKMQKQQFFQVKYYECYQKQPTPFQKLKQLKLKTVNTTFVQMWTSEKLKNQKLNVKYTQTKEKIKQFIYKIQDTQNLMYLACISYYDQSCDDQ